MSDISDEELILFHYRDGLPVQRLEHIEQQLARSGPLRTRHEQLTAALAKVDRGWNPEPLPGFEDRLWRGLHARINEPLPMAQVIESNVILWPAQRRVEAPPRRNSWRWGLGFASAAAVAFAVGIVFFQGESNESAQARRSPQVAVTADTVAERVLATKVADHLQSTEAMLLILLNDDVMDDPSAGELFAVLAQDNRLYSVAVQRRGNRQLAGFLGSMQAMLIELANQSNHGGIQPSQELREFVSSTDLLFQVRAVQAQLRSRSRSA